MDLAAVQPDSELALFVVDHAWTFTGDKVKEQLEATPGLLERMESLMQLASDDEEQLEKHQWVSNVVDRVWKFANTYRIGNLRPEEASAIWYVMDEFGSAIEHSDTPNMRMAPFYFAETQCAFSLLWPIEPLEAGDFLSRDYVPETQDADMRAAVLAALFYPPEQNTLVDEQEYMQQLFQAVTRRKEEYSLENARAKFHAIVSRDSEVLPNPATTTAEPPLAVAVSDASPLQVYSSTCFSFGRDLDFVVFDDEYFVQTSRLCTSISSTRSSSMLSQRTTLRSCGRRGTSRTSRSMRRTSACRSSTSSRTRRS